MLDAFDPTAFLAAEAPSLQALAGICYTPVDATPVSKVAENRAVPAFMEAPLAGLAGIAAGVREKHSWGGDLCRFVDAECPAFVSPELWDELTSEAWLLATAWGDEAASKGWTAVDLFGCNPDPFARRVDRDGLLLGIVGLKVPSKVVAIHRDVAELQCCDTGRSILRHRRGPALGSISVWHAYLARDGP